MRAFLSFLLAAGFGVAAGAAPQPIERAVAQFSAALVAPDIRAFDPLIADVKTGDLSWWDVREIFEAYDCVQVRSARITSVDGDDRTATVHLLLDATGVTRGRRAHERTIGGQWVLVLARDGEQWRIRTAESVEHALARRMLDSDDVAYDLSKLDMAKLARSMSDHAFEAADRDRKLAPRALTVMRRSIEIAAMSGDASAESEALRTTGAHERQLGHIDVALGLLDRSIAIARRVNDPDELASALLGKALTLWAAGESAQSLAILESIINDIDALDDPRRAIKASLMKSHYQSSMGDLRGAFVEARRLESLSRQYHWTEGEGFGAVQAGSVYSQLHEFALADEEFAHGQALFESIHNHGRAVVALQNRAAIAYMTGDKKRGEQLLREAIRGSATSLADDRAVSYTNLAIMQRERKAYAEADASLQEAINVARGADPRILSNALKEQALLRIAQGRPADALKSADESAAAAAKGIGHSAAVWAPWKVQAARGMALRRLGRLAEAEKELSAAIADIEANRKSYTATANSASYFDGKERAYYEYADLLVATHRNDEALRVTEQLKARVLEDALRQGRRNSSATMTDAETRKEQQLIDRVADLNKKLLQGETVRTNLDDARRELDRFHLEMAVMHPELRIQPAALVAEKPHLPASLKGAALVEYLVGRERSLVFVVTESKGKTRVDARVLPVNDESLERDVKRLDERIASRDLEWAAAAHRLERMLLEPIEPLIGGRKMIGFIPHDQLWRVPFQLLLIDRAAVFYAPSLAMLETAAQRAPAHRGPRELLAVGNPTYSAESASRYRSVSPGTKLGSLIDAEHEVEQIAALYGPSRTRVLMRDRAREDTVKFEADRFRVLHLATHGVIDDQAPMYSALVLATPPDGRDDGLLEAREILGMHLQADLAVLSACETGRGSITPGEGVVGMSWAFLIAGCPSTVVSRWNVASKATSKLMVDFHRRLLAGDSKPEALRKAALKLRGDARYSHPFYWAAFVLVGEP